MKIRCAYKKCRSQRCVKNVGREARAARTDVNADFCWYLHPAAEVVRFCGRVHRKLCSARTPVARGQREALDLQQYSALFYTLVRLGAPWAAALTLLQLVCGERADCARQARAGWLQHIDPGDDHPATVRIPKANGKTKAREIPIAPPVAALLHRWTAQGLRQPGGVQQQWPFLNDPRPQSPLRFLFPGKWPGAADKGRDWGRPVTVRGYRSKLAEAAVVLQRERATNKRRGASHPFDGFPLDRLGTHSFKRSAVSLMKDTCTSTALCGAIAGTTAKTLDRVYDMPTLKRQQALVARAFGPVASSLQREEEEAALPPRAAKRAKKKPGSPASAPLPLPPPRQSGAREGQGGAREEQDGAPLARFCAACGKRREEPSWACCPWCGHML